MIKWQKVLHLQVEGLDLQKAGLIPLVVSAVLQVGKHFAVVTVCLHWLAG